MARRLRLSLLVSLAAGVVVFAASVGSSGRAAAAGAYSLELVGAFSRPSYVTAPPGDSRLFVVEQAGRILVVAPDGTRRTFLDISSSVASSGEQGLLSMAFAPDYATSGHVFVYYTDLGGTIHISRYTRSATDGNALDPASALDILTIAHPSYQNHNGGQLQFGPDGDLYAGTGDGGSGGDPNGNGQNTATLLGKLLRLDVSASSAGQPYAIPPGQPIGTGAAPEVYAYGLRNPWRFSFDPQTGALFVGDVGQNAYEEVDAEPLGQALGRNFGWNRCEATHPYLSGVPAASCATAQAGYTPPVAEYTHSTGGCAIVGGDVVRTTTLPSLVGQYLYSDYCSGRIFAFTPPASGLAVASDLGLNVPAPSSFGVDGVDRIYVASTGGNVYRLSESGAPTAPAPAATNQRPVASFVVTPTPPVVGRPVRLDASGSHDPDGTIASYAWDTPDGAASGRVATHVFTRAGPAEVELTVTDDQGATTTVARTINVVRALPRPRGLLGVPGRQTVASILRRGLSLRCGANQTATCRLRVALTARDAHALRRQRLVWQHTLVLRTGDPLTIAAHLTSIRLALPRLVGHRLVVTAALLTAAGTTHTTPRQVRLRR